MIEESLRRFNEKYHLHKTLDPQALRILINYNWPGNVRELENVIEYLTVTTNTERISREDVPLNIIEYSKSSGMDLLAIDRVASLKEAVELVEKNMLLESMKRSKSTEEMAEALKVDRSTVIRKLQKYHIKTNFRDR